MIPLRRGTASRLGLRKPPRKPPRPRQRGDLLASDPLGLTARRPEPEVRFLAVPVPHMYGLAR